MTNLESLFFYLAAFLLAGILMHAGRKRKFTSFIFLALVIPIFVSGLRLNVGTDYPTYIENISYLWNVSFSAYISDFSSYLEPTFYLFTKIAHFFNFPHLVLFIYSAIGVVFTYKALKVANIKHASLVYLLILLIIFPMSFNMVRQFAAVAVAVYATSLLFNGNKKKYLLFTGVASLLHVSALVNIVAFIVYKWVNDKHKRSLSANKVIFGGIITAVVSVVAVYSLQKYGYLFEKYDSATSNLNFFPRFFMLLVVLTLWYTSRVTYRKYKMFIDLGVISIILGATGFVIPYGDRVALYFLPFVMMMLPTSIYYLMPGKKKYLTVPVTITIGVLYFVVSYYILGSHAIMPYDSIWSSWSIS